MHPGGLRSSLEEWMGRAKSTMQVVPPAAAAWVPVS